MVARTISPLISRSISRAINELEGAAFNPIALFAAGEQGVWYDPSDLSTLFQDAAGTIPVTAAGQPVGRVLDKSGRGNHASQATATSRPILQQSGGLWSLLFDGVDDWMVTGNIDFSATDKMTIWAGIYKASDATNSVFAELSTNASNTNGSFALFAPLSGAPSYDLRNGGTTRATLTRTTFTAPHKAVVVGETNIAAPSISMRVNTTTAAPLTSTQGTGNYGNLPLYLGMRSGLAFPFNGNFHGLIVRGVTSTTQQVTDAETWMNGKIGAY